MCTSGSLFQVYWSVAIHYTDQWLIALFIHRYSKVPQTPDPRPSQRVPLASSSSSPSSASSSALTSSRWCSGSPRVSPRVGKTSDPDSYESQSWPDCELWRTWIADILFLSFFLSFFFFFFFKFFFFLDNFSRGMGLAVSESVDQCGWMGASAGTSCNVALHREPHVQFCFL